MNTARANEAMETVRDMEKCVEQLKLALEGVIEAMEDRTISFQEGYRNTEDYEEARQEIANLSETLGDVEYLLSAPDTDEGPKEREPKEETFSQGEDEVGDEDT